MNHAQLFVTKHNFAHQTANYSKNRINTYLTAQGKIYMYLQQQLPGHNTGLSKEAFYSVTPLNQTPQIHLLSYCFCVSTRKAQFMLDKMILPLHFQTKKVWSSPNWTFPDNHYSRALKVLTHETTTP